LWRKVEAGGLVDGGGLRREGGFGGAQKSGLERDGETGRQTRADVDGDEGGVRGAACGADFAEEVYHEGDKGGVIGPALVWGEAEDDVWSVEGSPADHGEGVVVQPE